MLIRIFAANQTIAQPVESVLKQIRLGMRNAVKAGADWMINVCDPMTWGAHTTHADLHIYLEVPCRLAVPWAAYNVVVVNPETWRHAAWSWCMEKGETDVFVFKSSEAAGLFEKISKQQKYIITYSDREKFLNGWRHLIAQRMIQERHMPIAPIHIPKGAVIPKVGLITVTRNRADWWSNMVGSVMNTLKSWPVNRLEWILVDDSDSAERIDSKVQRLQEDMPTLVVKYVSLTDVKTVGEKRNLAVSAASEDVDVFACVDDDDHYPPGSLERRVSWLMTAGKGASYCSSLPMYDITRYISAMNVPPLHLAPAHRVSEATLTFTRRFWEEKGFPDVGMAEGEEFISGRESATVEIPPYGIIVSFIHKGNTSSRRTPEDQEPNGSHYRFSDKYFEYIHMIGGIEV